MANAARYLQVPRRDTDVLYLRKKPASPTYNFLHLFLEQLTIDRKGCPQNLEEKIKYQQLFELVPSLCCSSNR